MSADPRLAFFNPFRVIPCLLVDGGGMVKTERFRKPRYLGDILNGLRIFNEKEVDELAVLDIEAARLRRPPSFDFITELASECFMPLAYGGGITSAGQAAAIIRAGVEKVVLNTTALENPQVLRDISSTVGSQSVVASLDFKRRLFGGSSLMVRSGSRKAGIEVEAAVAMLEDAGTGELLVQSVDRDGTLSGYDIDIIRRVSMLTSLPVIASGGASSLADLANAVHAGGASAVAAGALFVYQGPHRAVLISYPTPSDLHQALEENSAST